MHEEVSIMAEAKDKETKKKKTTTKKKMTMEEFLDRLSETMNEELSNDKGEDEEEEES